MNDECKHINEVRKTYNERIGEGQLAGVQRMSCSKNEDGLPRACEWASWSPHLVANFFPEMLTSPSPLLHKAPALISPFQVEIYYSYKLAKYLLANTDREPHPLDWILWSYPWWTHWAPCGVPYNGLDWFLSYKRFLLWPLAFTFFSFKSLFNVGKVETNLIRWDLFKLGLVWWRRNNDVKTIIIYYFHSI